MAYSYTNYTGNGSTTQFSVAMPYIRKEHIHVYVNNVEVSFTWVNSTTALLASAPANGAVVQVRRVTPILLPLVDYSDGSTFVAADLDTSNLQLLYIEQELDDNSKQGIYVDPATGQLTAGGQKIGNVGTPTVGTDAATKAYVDTADAAVVAAVAANAANAATSATSANAAKVAAETARDQTLAAYDNFDDRYLGAKASDPALDNDGNALVGGSLYYNTTAQEMRLWTGSAWVAAYVSGIASGIGFAPFGGISATNVQNAIQELDSEKMPIAGLVNYQEFTSSGTWTKPAGVTAVYVECIGGGGGGGSGRRGATNTNRSGGGGGGSGFFAFQQLVASAVSSTVTVTVGAGGTGGAAVTANDTNGNTGTTGGASTFGSYVSSHTSGAGGGGTTTAGTPGHPVAVEVFGKQGGSGGTYDGTAATLCPFGPAGGGGGGGAQTGGFAGSGGNGGNGFVTKKTSYTPAAGGAAGGNPGANGSGEGDGGGGGSSNLTGAGYAGGNGSFPGGGGGGGGASLNGFSSGAGGNGAAGVVRVWSW